jgi:class 3 adenylate cyclase
VSQRASRNLDDPDEIYQYPGAIEHIVKVGEWTVGRVTQEPGWRYSRDMAALAGTEWCQSRHVGVVISGRQGVVLEDGTVLEFGPGDVYDIPPAHDGYTIGDEPAVLIEWTGLQAWGGRGSRFMDRMLATLLLTDLIDSTVQAARLGDSAWRDLLGRHYEGVRAELQQYRGREVDTTGDGLLAWFDSPARAVRCAEAIHRAASSIGVRVRIGIHTGEVERVGSNLRGLAVHEVARVTAAAGDGEVIVSQTTHDLAAASGIAFEDRGEQTLKGLEGPRRLWAVVG